MNTLALVNSQGLKPKRTLLFPDKNEQGQPLGTAENLFNLLEHLNIKPAQNLMNLEFELFINGEPLAQSYDSKRSFLISECLKENLPKTIIDGHLSALCERNPCHPARDYLEGHQ
ncbi:hypothetical protein [Vibrio sp. F74]|uniref:hypothetical protein n=1 Tax=Vibrio sp. F74 TaxID=700020 RepID=UPI0035F58446